MFCLITSVCSLHGSTILLHTNVNEAKGKLLVETVCFKDKMQELLESKPYFGVYPLKNSRILQDVERCIGTSKDIDNRIKLVKQVFLKGYAVIQECINLENAMNILSARSEKSDFLDEDRRKLSANRKEYERIINQCCGNYSTLCQQRESQQEINRYKRLLTHNV